MHGFSSDNAAHLLSSTCQKEGTQIQWIYWGCNRLIVLFCLWPSGLGQRPLFIVGLAFSHSVAEPHYRVAEAPLVWLRHFRYSHGFGHGWNHTLSDMACASMVLASTFVAMARNHPHSDSTQTLYTSAHRPKFCPSFLVPCRNTGTLEFHGCEGLIEVLVLALWLRQRAYMLV